ncbi:hypothetical protein HF520_07525 [Romboutsia sp. CE17]|uniref:flavoprotein n=1 Tax=Romboutsia sp. CE17 TaxID=2724150 RepID=UPI001442B8B8|nr:flavoprotein [Romboutsia sp. CE17]QJA08804.1 hypothetical protein HF520_07525 [Romboutsia sp. CE17]
MNQKNQLESIIEESIIDYIVEKVVEKIINRSKRGLILFTGATIGYSQSIESINKLKRDGWEFDVVMSKSAQEVITVDSVKKAIGVSNIITNENGSVIKELLQRNNVIVIPTLTINSAAKIANCISDTLVTNIVSKALMSGKPIVASINGCCPDNKERREIYGDNLSDFHKKRLSNNLEILRSYNIKLSSSEKLYKNVNKILLKSFNLYKSNKFINEVYVSNGDKVVSSNAEPKTVDDISSIRLNKKVLSRKDIWDNKKFSTIFIKKNTLITDLAKDEAQRLNITLTKE